MKIVIDIQDDVYRVLKDDIYPIPDTERLALVFKTLVKKGTPLPKGHGRLIDADEFKFDILTIIEPDLDRILDYLTDAQTIIEADKKSEE